MVFNPSYILDFGKNKGFTLSEIYKYVPDYLEWLIKIIPEIEIDVNDFIKLPKPTVTNAKHERRNGLLIISVNKYTPIKGILSYKENGGEFIELDFAFSDETLQILELKRVGKYIAPAWEKSQSYSSEEVDILLYTLEGLFYVPNGKHIDYFRFYRDKTVISVAVDSREANSEVLAWINKEHPNLTKGEYKIYSTWIREIREIRMLGEKLNINSKIKIQMKDPIVAINRNYSGEIISKNEIHLRIGDENYNNNRIMKIYKKLR